MKTSSFPPDAGDSARAGQDHHRQPWSSLSSAPCLEITSGLGMCLSSVRELMSTDRFLLISLQMDSVFPGVNPGSEAFLGCSKVPVLLPGVPTLAACGFKDRGDCQNSVFFFVPAFLCRRRGQGCLCIPLVVFPGALLVTDIC